MTWAWATPEGNEAAAKNGQPRVLPASTTGTPGGCLAQGPWNDCGRSTPARQ